MACLRYDILVNCRIDSGAGLSYLRFYHSAVVLCRVLDWFHRSASKQLVHLKIYISQVPLTFLAWIQPTDCPPPPTLSIWERALKTYGISSYPGPMILGNQFPPGLNTEVSLRWRAPTPSPILQAFDPTGLKLLRDIAPFTEASGCLNFNFHTFMTCLTRTVFTSTSPHLRSYASLTHNVFVLYPHSLASFYRMHFAITHFTSKTGSQSWGHTPSPED